MKELWKHQIEGISRAVQGNYFGFFFDPGLGKTRTMIEVLRRVFASNNQVVDTTIVSPLITLQNWKKEILMFSKVNPKDVIVLTGSGANKAKQVRSAGPNKIFVTNYESLLNKELLQAFLERGIKTLICDESHYVKNPTSKRTKAVHALAERAFYRYILTGTPVLNSAEDIWAQAYILDLGQRFEKKFFYFKTKYFEDKNRSMPKAKYFPNWVVRPSALEAFNKMLSEMTMSAKKEECLDLPPLLVKEVEVELTAKQRKHYDEVRKHFITYCDDAACVASIALTKALRMQEIASGYMSLDNGESILFEENPKLDALEELLETYQKHKIIVWANFVENHKMIARLLDKKGIKYVMLTGAETPNEKFASMEAFEKDPEVRVCIGSQAVGIGVNLVSSSVSIYFSCGFKLGDDIQSEARNHRSGSEIHEAIYRINLIASNTLDRTTHDALRDKKVLGLSIIKESVQNN